MAEEVRVLRHWWQHMLGYMFQRPKGKLVFEFPTSRRVSIHTWFVFGTIDVMLMERGRVVEKVRLPPWRFWTSKKKVKTFVEMPVKK